MATIRITQEARGRVPGDGVDLAFGYWPGAGTPVLAIHGITANFMNFIGIAQKLSGRSPVLALDLRGRGDSDKPPGPYGFAQHARDVAAAIRTMQLGPSLIVGHSMGAFVAAALAAESPELVKAVVLIDGGYVLPSSVSAPANGELNAALAERINQLTTQYPSRAAYREFWKAKPNFPPDEWNSWIEAFLDYEVGDCVAGEVGPVQPKALQSGVLADLMEGAKRDEILDRLRSIRVPVTMLRAETGFTREQKPLYPDALVDGIRECVPQVQDRKLNGTTHYTIVLGQTGASTIADVIADMNQRRS